MKHTRLIGTVLVTLSGLFSSHALATDRALIIGVGQYSDSRNNLPGIDLDVQMAKGIAQRLGFTAQQTRVLLDRQATRSGILQAMTQIATETTANDRVFIYFSGHGQQVADLNGDENDGCDEALVPYDNDNPLIDDDLAAALNRIPAPEVLFLADSCFSATVTKTRVRGAVQKFLKSTAVCNEGINKGSRAVATEARLTGAGVQANGNKGIIEFTAAADNEYAIASSKGSLFTRGLFEAVQKSGNMSFQALQAYAHDFIQKNTTTPSTPSLDGPVAWLSRSLFDFGKLRAAGRQLPDPSNLQNADDPAEAFNILAQKSTSKIDLTSNKPSYALREDIQFTITAPISGYLNVLELASSGEVTVLYPNRYQPNNRIEARATLQLPDDSFNFSATEPLGTSQILALITQEPLNLRADLTSGELDDGFRFFVDNAAFRQFIELVDEKAVATTGKGRLFAAGMITIRTVP